MDDYSQPATLRGYLSLRREQPDWFCNRAGGIEILTRVEDIQAAREAARAMRASEGLDVDDLRTGVLARDPYMTVLRDAVRFPDGTLGLYNRIVELCCVAVLPLLGSRLVLVKIFRHGLRDWSLEFPRGGCDPNETPEEAARRELYEEIEANVLELIPLGTFSPGGSSLSIRAELFAARVEGIGRPDRGDGISEIRVFDTTEVEEQIRSSRIIDGFTLATFLRARLAGIV